MATTTNQPTSRLRTYLLVGVFGLIAAGACVAIWWQVRPALFGLPPRNSNTAAAATGGAPDSGRLSPFGRGGPMGTGPLFNEAERQKIAEEIGLSAEQQEQVAKIFAEPAPSSLQDRFKRMEDAMKVLTPEQLKKMREVIPNRVAARLEQRKEQAKKVLSAEDYAAFERRLDGIQKNLREGRSPFPGMPAPPGFGPPPPGEGL